MRAVDEWLEEEFKKGIIVKNQTFNNNDVHNY